MLVSDIYFVSSALGVDVVMVMFSSLASGKNHNSVLFCLLSAGCATVAQSGQRDRVMMVRGG